MTYPPHHFTRLGQGLCCSALFVIAWPVADKSWPAPAVVLQAPNIGATAISSIKANALEPFLRMADILRATFVNLAIWPVLSRGTASFSGGSDAESRTAILATPGFPFRTCLVAVLSESPVSAS
jgi:hypothetical protein